MDMMERSNVLVDGIGWDLVYKYKWFAGVVGWVVNIEEGLGNFFGVSRKDCKGCGELCHAGALGAQREDRF